MKQHFGKCSRPPRAPQARRPRDAASTPLALTIPPDPIGLTPDHLRALGLAVRTLEDRVKAARLGRTQSAIQQLTLAHDALGRLERRYGSAR